MTDKMREEFETAVALEAKEPVLAVYLSRRGDTYSTSTLHFAWWAWKASREALVIELPAENPLGTGPGDCEGGLPSFEQHCAAECNFILRDCREAIEAAGLKVKP